MTALRALICDDEELARELVREYLTGHPDIAVVGEAVNGLDAAKAIGELAPDLVFLDIHMPKLTGLEVLELTGRRDGVIFTTAYDQYAQKAFDLHAVDYLLKPFAKARFDDALARARARLGAAASAAATPTAATALDKLIAHPSEWLERILIRDREQVHVIPVADVEYVEAQSDYIAVHAGGRDYLKTQRISDLETQLDPKHFVRVHRSFIVHLAFLQGIERFGSDGHAARMKGGKRVPISRSGYERLRAVM